MRKAWFVLVAIFASSLGIAWAKQDATQAADAARKAAAYVSFWTFMSLLFGAACATLGGVLGGDLRDDFAIRQAVPTSPR